VKITNILERCKVKGIDFLDICLPIFPTHYGYPVYSLLWKAVGKQGWYGFPFQYVIGMEFRNNHWN
jgi:hypothetical protein